MILHCLACSGEGRKYSSRYGGNDPDVYETGKCEACGGSGNERCHARGCEQDATVFDEDGRALCEDCLIDWLNPPTYE